MVLLFLVSFIVVNVLLFGVADLWSFATKRKGWDRFVSTFLLSVGQIIASEFVLGLFSLLSWAPLVILNVIISSASLYLLSKTYSSQMVRKYVCSLPRLVINPLKEAHKDWQWAALLLLCLSTIAWVLFVGLLFPPLDFDGNSYHMTFIANVMQYGNFHDYPTSLAWLNGYPKGGEFLGLWSVVLLRSDVLADMIQIPFAIFGIYALYSVAVSLGARKEHARFAALLFLFVPVVINQLKTTYVDVMLVSLFFGGLALLLTKKLSKFDYVLIGIVFSLLLSIKSTGALFIAGLFPLLLYRLLNTGTTQKHGWRKKLLLPFAYIIPPMFFGLYWYIKNLVMYGSPIYPFGFKVLGHSIFPGKTFQEFAADAVNQSTVLPHGCFNRIWFVWTEQKDWFGCMYNYDTNYAGLGPVWFVLLIPAILVTLFIAVRKKSWLLVGIGAVFWAVFAIYPINYYSRYTLFIIGAGVYSLAIIMGLLSKGGVRFVRSLALALALVVLFSNLALCNYPFGTVRKQFVDTIRGAHPSEAFDNAGWAAFNTVDRLSQKNDVVAYDSAPYFIYPLWRADFTNDVVYIPSQSQADWAKQVHAKHVSFYLTTLQSREHKWLLTSSNFISIHKDGLYEVFEAR